MTEIIQKVKPSVDSMKIKTNGLRDSMVNLLPDIENMTSKIRNAESDFIVARGRLHVAIIYMNNFIVNDSDNVPAHDTLELLYEYRKSMGRLFQIFDAPRNLLCILLESANDTDRYVTQVLNSVNQMSELVDGFPNDIDKLLLPKDAKFDKMEIETLAKIWMELENVSNGLQAENDSVTKAEKSVANVAATVDAVMNMYTIRKNAIDKANEIADESERLVEPFKSRIVPAPSFSSCSYMKSWKFVIAVVGILVVLAGIGLNIFWVRRSDVVEEEDEIEQVAASVEEISVGENDLENSAFISGIATLTVLAIL